MHFKEGFRYLLRTGFIVASTQLLFQLLLNLEPTSNWEAIANLIAIISLMPIGFLIDKRFVWQARTKTSWSEIKEFISVSIAPTIISPLAVATFSDQPDWFLSIISLGVFGFFWALRFILHRKRWS